MDSQSYFEKSEDGSAQVSDTRQDDFVTPGSAHNNNKDIHLIEIEDADLSGSQTPPKLDEYGNPAMTLADELMEL